MQVPLWDHLEGNETMTSQNPPPKEDNAEAEQARIAKEAAAKEQKPQQADALETNQSKHQDLVRRLREGGRNARDQALLAEAADAIDQLSNQGKTPPKQP
jgi:hypothetical protein